LRHAVERATILAHSDRLTPEDFPFAFHRPAPPRDSAEDLDLERTEKRTIERALKLYDGNISRAAAALGLTRPALYRRMSKHRI
jgi:DNA-binding NtrC family response regulator